MTTLITGGAGFIGSHLAKALSAQGEPLVILDNFNDYYDPALKRENVAPLEHAPDVAIIEGDVRDEALLDRIMATFKVRRIAHMAAMAGVRNSINEAGLYFDVNVSGSLRLMDMARKYGTEQFVQASTSSVYGETQRLPFLEDDAADRPLAPYPASKRAAEMLAHSYHHLFDMNFTCLRFFNVYGPAGRPDMMPLKVIKALVEGAPITLFNNGAFSRDWTYIDDIVDGVVAALDRPLGYQVINLGCGNPLSMSDFVDVLEELTGRPGIRTNVPAPLSEPPITFCDNNKARDLLGFAPRVEVKDGLARTWAWYRQAHQVR